MMQPLAIDLFCGLGGWSEGLLAQGWFVVGFDIERHVYGDHRYPGELVLQDVLTIHGSQFKDADIIVASPPCQFFSYCAMPWKRAKALAATVRADPVRMAKETALFRACFRIQREACEAAGRHIPLIVENVRGAIPWVGRSRWNFGSFHLWGDVPALMPSTSRGSKVPGFRFDGSGASFQSASVSETGIKNPGLDWSKYGDADYRTSGAGACFRDSAIKNTGGSWFNVAHNTTSGKGNNPDGRKGIPHRPAGHLTNSAEHEGIKCGGDWFNAEQPSISRLTGSKSPARKAASAMIAKIPFPLAQYIAATFKPASISNAA